MVKSSVAFRRTRNTEVDEVKSDGLAANVQTQKWFNTGKPGTDGEVEGGDG